MSFFESDIIKGEIDSINYLQERLYASMFNFYTMDKNQKLEHVGILESLLEKQKILYTRIKLSDDPKAVEMKNNIRTSAASMGLPENVDMTVLFDNMEKMVEKMKDRIRSEG
jgi:hypothetical protein